jgi:hypothetical protein
MMGGWGPTTEEQRIQARKNAERRNIEEPWREKVAKLEAQLAKKDLLIDVLKNGLKKLAGDAYSDNGIVDIIQELIEISDS